MIGPYGHAMGMTSLFPTKYYPGRTLDATTYGPNGEIARRDRMEPGTAYRLFPELGPLVTQEGAGVGSAASGAAICGTAAHNSADTTSGGGVTSGGGGVTSGGGAVMSGGGAGRRGMATVCPAHAPPSMPLAGWRPWLCGCVARPQLVPQVRQQQVQRPGRQQAWQLQLLQPGQRELVQQHSKQQLRTERQQ